MRRVMVRVLPVPAPASTHTGPRAARTASRCSSSRSPVMSSRSLDGASTGMRSILAGRCDKSRARRGHVGGIRYVDRLMSAADHVHHLVVWLLLPPEEDSEGGGNSASPRSTSKPIRPPREFVASVNGGNQTVPTLKFADGSTLTNPSGARGQGQARLVTSRRDRRNGVTTRTYAPVWSGRES